MGTWLCEDIPTSVYDGGGVDAGVRGAQLPQLLRRPHVRVLRLRTVAGAGAGAFAGAFARAFAGAVSGGPGGGYRPGRPLLLEEEAEA